MKCTQILIYPDRSEVNGKRGIQAENKTLGIQDLNLFIAKSPEFGLDFGRNQKEYH